MALEQCRNYAGIRKASLIYFLFNEYGSRGFEDIGLSREAKAWGDK
jgi:hypothetical protein